MCPDYPWMARPTVNASPNASCSRPVCPSVAIRPGPETPPRTARTGANGQRQRDQHEQRERPVHRDQRGKRERHQEEQQVHVRARASPIRTASVRFPAVASEPMSRRLLIISSAHGQQPGRDRRREPEPGEPPHLHERGPGHRRHAEEHEDGHLAEPPVPVGTRPAGVEPGGEHAQRPAGDDPPRRHRGEHQPEARRPRGSRQRRRRFTARGDAAPDPTSRIGPARRPAASVPRTPSL